MIMSLAVLDFKSNLKFVHRTHTVIYNSTFVSSQTSTTAFGQLLFSFQFHSLIPGQYPFTMFSIPGQCNPTKNYVQHTWKIQSHLSYHDNITPPGTMFSTAGILQTYLELLPAYQYNITLSSTMFCIQTLHNPIWYYVQHVRIVRIVQPYLVPCSVYGIIKPYLVLYSILQDSRTLLNTTQNNPTQNRGRHITHITYKRLSETA